MSAATRVIAAQGLSAPTAAIAKDAAVSNGSLFTYFQTKADLLNALYVELKGEIGHTALDGLPPTADVHAQMFHIWVHWLGWASSYPDKRRTLAHLSVSDEVTAQSHHAASLAMADIAKILEQSRKKGPMRDAPIGLVVALMGALADATIDFIIRDPVKADDHGKLAFEALWRIVH